MKFRRWLPIKIKTNITCSSVFIVLTGKLSVLKTISELIKWTPNDTAIHVKVVVPNRPRTETSKI